MSTRREIIDQADCVSQIDHLLGTEIPQLEAELTAKGQAVPQRPAEPTFNDGSGRAIVSQPEHLDMLQAHVARLKVQVRMTPAAMAAARQRIISKHPGLAKSTTTPPKTGTTAPTPATAPKLSIDERIKLAKAGQASKPMTITEKVLAIKAAQRNR